MQKMFWAQNGKKTALWDTWKSRISHYTGWLSGTAYRRDRRCRTHSLGRKMTLATHSYESAVYEVTHLQGQLSFIKLSLLSPRAAMVPRGLRKNFQAISTAQKSEITSVRKVYWRFSAISKLTKQKIDMPFKNGKPWQANASYYNLIHYFFNPRTTMGCQKWHPYLFNKKYLMDFIEICRT